nr:receptor-like protein EIX2 [Ipomoea batatas]
MKHTKHNIMLVLIFLLLICKFEYCYSNDARCVEGEQIALLQFKESLIDTSNGLFSWSGPDCCEWEEISCSSTTGHVLKLDLHNPAKPTRDDIDNYYYGLPSNYINNCLGGEINHSLINLTHLNYLDLSLNNFSKIRIPEFFGSFKNLRYLNFSSSGFVGNIPTHLGNLSSLEYLHLGEALDGVIYNHLATNLDWIASLSSLKSLDMPWISIRHSKDWLRTINKLVSLSSLNLADCHLNTTSPLLHVNSTSLISLDLSWNSLDSAILPWLSNLTRLEHLNLGFNSLNSSMLEIFEPLAPLKVLDLFGNAFTGTLVPLCKLHNLVFMDLNSNNFQGSIPNCLGNLTSLTSLSLSGNRFTSSIPNSLGNLTSLTSLSLSANSFTGSIPSCLGNLTSLTSLSLSHNSFTGSIPNSLGNLTYLTSLDLNSNRFASSIPNSLGNLTYLTSLDLSGNMLAGSIPSCLRNFTSLTSLDLSANMLAGSIPICLGNLTSLTVLSLNNNIFTGSIPNTIGSSVCRLQELYFSWNKLTDYIAVLFDCLLDSLNILYLEFNNFSGQLPNQLYKYKNLEILSVSSNSFAGPIIESVGNLSMLLELDISNNKFSGSVPSSLGELSNLEELHISDNSFIGVLSEFHFSKLSKLDILDISSNLFVWNVSSTWVPPFQLYVIEMDSIKSGPHFPHWLRSQRYVGYLHLQNNELEGKLPGSMQNLTSLIILDLSENKFMDVIPTWIGEKLLSLKYLVFYINKFYGDIPLQLCQLHDLQLLNLANNNISGYIP